MIERLFVDTAYVQALSNVRDQMHDRARALVARAETAEQWTTEAVLVEIGDGLAAYDRRFAATFIRACLIRARVRVIPVDRPILLKALALFESRRDKEWGLTDCISFVVMSQYGIASALTADRHFVQAGFRALMLEEF